MSEFVIFVLLYFILFGAIGLDIGQRKGRPLAGLIWSMLLGPIGWLLIFIGPTVGGGEESRLSLLRGRSSARPSEVQSLWQCG